MGKNQFIKKYWMPNHIHGILFFNRPDKKDWTPDQFGVQSQNLGSVIRAFKSTTKRYANQNNIKFEWQSGYHDRIIRNEKELNAIRQYIINNPLNWAKDVLNIPPVETGNCPSDITPAGSLKCPSDVDKTSTIETGNCPSLHQIIEKETENLLKEIIES